MPSLQEREEKSSPAEKRLVNAFFRIYSSYVQKSSHRAIFLLERPSRGHL